MNKKLPARLQYNGPVFSYIRFSSAKQAEGHSLDRQTEAEQKWCAEHGVAVTRYQDLGISGYDGSNRRHGGALQQFLAAVEEGHIPPGSTLLIERFDRLSREDLSVVVPLVLGLVNAGIRIVTLHDRHEYTQANINDLGVMVQAAVIMSRANEESATKSKHIKASWQAKRDRASEVRLTKEAPRWLQLNADRRTWTVDESRAESIRKVFELAKQGLGLTAIIHTANREGWPVPGRANVWHLSRVKRLLRERAVLGEFQPHRRDDDGVRIPAGDPVVGYFPAVVSESDWLQVQAVLNRRRGLPGRRDNARKNWLQGLLRCGQCMGTARDGTPAHRNMRLKNISRGQHRYWCAGRAIGATSCTTFRPSLIEGAVLRAVALHNPEKASAERNRRLTRIAELEAIVAQEAVKVGRLLDFISEGNDSKIVREKYHQANSSMERSQLELKVLQAEATEPPSQDVAARLQELELLGGATATPENREALRTDLLRVLDSVIVAVEGNAPKLGAPLKLHSTSTRQMPVRDGVLLVTAVFRDGTTACATAQISDEAHTSEDAIQAAGLVPSISWADTNDAP